MTTRLVLLGGSSLAKSFATPLIFILALLIPNFTSNAHAQVTQTPGVEGLNTQVNKVGSIYEITGGIRPDNGPNLFHSFGEFSITTVETARFSALVPDITVGNILGRVTSGNPSNIFGTIDSISFYPNANLFLMNPAGILFGPNASLNVGGSVNFTTANYLKLSDSVRFNAIPDMTSDGLLSSAPVMAFGFLGSDAASIAITGGTLEVPSGGTLSFVGGPTPFAPAGGNPVPPGVTMTGGSLSAPNGLIYMATVTSPSEILLPALSGNPLGNLTVPSASPAIIRIRSGEFVMDRAFLTVSNTTATHQPPIDIHVQGTMILRNASSISTETSGTGRASDIQVAAQALQVDGSFITSKTTGGGRGGDITVSTGMLDLANGAQIVSSTAGTNDGGDITLAAADTALISGFDTTGSLTGITSVLLVDQNTGLPAVASGIFSTTSSSGNGGQIHLSAPTAAVTLQNGGTIATIASGDGSGGNIAVESETMDVTDGGQIASFTGADLALGEFTGGIGLGGNITVSAQDSIALSGFSSDLSISSSVSSQTFGPGKGGDISTSAPTTHLDSGGQLVASSFAGEAPAGNISVSAPSNLLIAGSNPLSTSQIQTETGSISVTAGSVTLTDQAFVNTGGDIAFQVENDLTVTAGGSITTSGGAIEIIADQVAVTGHVGSSRSQITSLASEETAAGDITIIVRDLQVADRGLIRSESTGGGQNGSIAIKQADSVTIIGLGEISTFNQVGPAGQVTVEAHTVTLNQGVISTTASGAGDANAINLMVDNLTLDKSLISSATNGGTARGGDVTIKVIDNFAITGLFTNDSGLTSPSGILARTFATGDAGNVTVTAGNIQVSDGGRINSSSLSSGNGGMITMVGDSISLSGASSGLFSEASSSGNGGIINVQVPQIQVANGAIISTKSTGTGAAGSVIVEGANSPAQSILIDGPGSGIFTETQGAGAGGNITAWANQVQLTNDAMVSAKTTGSGDAGNILVKADTVNMNSGATITAASTGSGNAGTVTIQGLASPAQSILIDGSGSGLFTDTQGTGAGGNIFVNANSVTLQNSGALSAKTSGTETTATGGSITVTSTDQVNMTSGASISASSIGDADAGNITINAGNRFEARNSSVTTNSEKAGGGNIEINALDQIRLVNSQVNASAFLNGGNISIDPNVVVLQNSQILAQAIQGAGGNITIFTPLFLADSTSLVSASSQFGLNGTVTIQSPTSNLSGGLGPLTSKPSQAQSLLTQRCAALANGQASSFVVAGREQLPADPGGWLTSPLYAASVGEGQGARGKGLEGMSAGAAPATMGIAAYDTDRVSLRRLTPARFLIANFADSEATGCHS